MRVVYTAAEIGIEAFPFHSTPDERYRATPPLDCYAAEGRLSRRPIRLTCARGLIADDLDVQLNLTDSQKRELTEYLKSL